MDSCSLGTAAAPATLGVEKVAGKSVVVSAFATSPLRLLTPKNHGHAAWVYTTTLGGGLVGGDEVALSVRVGPGATALLASQAQTKVYRVTGARPTASSSQRLEIDVADGATFASVPEPVACFRGARFEQTTRARLGGPDASVLILDALTCGRAAFGERWAFDRYRSRIVVERLDGKVVLDDAMELDPRLGGDLATRMRGFEAVATVVAAGPRTRALRDGWTSLAPDDGVRRAVYARAEHDLAVLRLAARTAELLARATRAALRNLADILGDDPFQRRP